MTEKTEKTETAVARRRPLFSDLDQLGGRDPFRSLMDRFMGDLAVDWPRTNGIESPKVDITETDGAYHVRAELPGVSKNDVTVEFEDDVLSIRGEKKTERDEKTEKGRRLECSYGAFSRAFTLPADADRDRIEAKFKDGVLQIKIQKNPDRKPKQIAIKG